MNENIRTNTNYWNRCYEIVAWSMEYITVQNGEVEIVENWIWAFEQKSNEIFTNLSDHISTNPSLS